MADVLNPLPHLDQCLAFGQISRLILAAFFQYRIIGLQRVQTCNGILGTSVTAMVRLDKEPYTVRRMGRTCAHFRKDLGSVCSGLLYIRCMSYVRRVPPKTKCQACNFQHEEDAKLVTSRVTYPTAVRSGRLVQDKECIPSMSDLCYISTLIASHPAGAVSQT